jgi:hypothetical protein
MAEEFGEPMVQDQNRSKPNIFLIVVLVIIILCCCCCAVAAALFYGTEPAMELLGIPIPW